jgi:carboxypeptidase C (cathepsin A)
MDTFNFNMYSGYLPVRDTSKSLHYLFAESQSSPSTDPVLIWFNGGPGCSSMLAFIQEHGPWVMESGTDYFHKNEYSWNYFANVLYIESPGGVGYSTCKGEDCTFDDNNSAQDNLDAILYWYETLFPEY